VFSWFPYHAETKTYSASKPGAELGEETEVPREQLSRELKYYIEFVYNYELYCCIYIFNNDQ
jgi:hypothetical protein